MKRSRVRLLALVNSVQETIGRLLPATHIVWAIRRFAIGQLLGEARPDQLEERGKLGSRVRSLLGAGRLEL